MDIEAKLYLNNIEYYLLKDIQEQYPKYSNIYQRAEFTSEITSFHNKIYITSTGYERILFLINLQENYYNQYQLQEKFNTRDKAEKQLMKLLDSIFPYITDGDYHYYAKENIDKYTNINQILSQKAGFPVINTLELSRYYTEHKLYHANLLNLAQYHYHYLYPSNRLIEIDDFLCIIIKSKNYIQEFENICKNISTTDFFDNYFSQTQKLTQTVKLMRTYYILTINKSNSSTIEAVAKNYIDLLYQMLNVLTKDILNYTEQEISHLIQNNDFISNYKFLIQFISYLQKSEYKFLPNLKTIKVKANNKKEIKNQQIYSPKKFAELFYAATNTDNHVEKAYKDYIYAQYWLAILILLTNFTRVSDIFNTPVLSLPYNFEWEYLITHKLQLVEAQSICNHFEFIAENLRINKTGKTKKLHFLADQIETVATAIIICNQHALKNNMPRLFSATTLEEARVYQKLGDPFSDISNRKLNYTLATYFEKTGTTATEYREEVYRLLSFMRGHKMENYYTPSETTTIYIKALNNNESIQKIAYHTALRGTFGWLYHIMLNFAGNKYNTIKSETEIVKELQKRYNPNNVEQISEYIIQEATNRETAIKAINKFSKGYIKTFLQSINTNAANDKNVIFPCILGNICPTPGKNCAYCQFSIKTVHSMIVYKQELELLLKSLEHNKTSALTIKRNMYLIFQILIIIKEFKTEFDNKDKNYINAFINLKEIKNRMDKLPMTYTNILMEAIKNEKRTT